MSAARCPVCGTDSLVTILREGDDGERQLRQFCRECARRGDSEVRSRQPRIAASFAAPLTWSGILLLALALTADYLSISGRSGFGWRQVTGAELGFLCVVLGVLLQRAFVGTAGLFLLVLSLLADLLALGHAPGPGWRMRAALVAGTVLVAAGLFLRRETRRPGSPGAPDDPPAAG
ncbi:MAG TPA: hypothetical protein VE359_18580 [Vicinamibacteria bacterium]|jgi:hypothetical protein|nr:hypothetical protein [Vicinamibacteria bacterium]